MFQPHSPPFRLYPLVPTSLVNNPVLLHHHHPSPPQSRTIMTIHLTHPRTERYPDIPTPQPSLLPTSIALKDRRRLLADLQEPSSHRHLSNPFCTISLNARPTAFRGLSFGNLWCYSICRLPGRVCRAGVRDEIFEDELPRRETTESLGSSCAFLVAHAEYVLPKAKAEGMAGKSSPSGQ